MTYTKPAARAVRYDGDDFSLLTYVCPTRHWFGDFGEAAFYLGPFPGLFCPVCEVEVDYVEGRGGTA